MAVVAPRYLPLPFDATAFPPRCIGSFWLAGAAMPFAKVRAKLNKRR